MPTKKKIMLVYELEKSRRSLEEGDEGFMAQMLRKNICCKFMALYQTCLTIGPITSSISLFERAPWIKQRRIRGREMAYYKNHSYIPFNLPEETK